MMAALGFTLFLLAGAVALAVIIKTTADYWQQARAALITEFQRGFEA